MNVWTYSGSLNDPLLFASMTAITFSCLMGLAVSRRWVRNPSIRYGVLLMSLLGCWCVPIVAWAVGSTVGSLVRIPVLDGGEIQPVVQPSQPDDMDIDSMRQLPLPTFALNLPQLGPKLPSEQPASIAKVEPIAFSKSIAPKRGFDLKDWSASTVVGSVWMTGTLLLLAFIGRSHQRGQAIRREGRVCDRTDVGLAVVRTSGYVGLGWMPRVIESDHVSAPLVIGIWRPELLLPTNLIDKLGVERFHSILIHELAHIRRRDTSVVLLEAISRAVFWPIVPVHMLLRALDSAREDVCDNEVLRHGNAIEYAETLLAIARRFHQASQWNADRGPTLTTGMMGTRGQLEHRVKSLLDPQRQLDTRLSWRVWCLLAAAFITFSVAVTGTRLVAMPSPMPQGDEPQSVESTTQSAVDAGTVAKEHQHSKAATQLFEIRVVNNLGQPIEAVDVVLWATGGASSDENYPNRNLGSNSFEGRTDADGRLSVRYPVSITIGREGKYQPGPLLTDSLGLLLMHPDYPTWRGFRKLSDGGLMTMSRPVPLSINASLEDGTPITSNLHGLTNSKADWYMRDGRLISSPISIEGAKLRVVHVRGDDEVFFSDDVALTEFEIRKADRGDATEQVNIDVTLHPAVRLIGELDREVPRPVRNGLMTAVTHTPNQLNRAWWMTTKIDEAGTFELSHVPRDCDVQFIASCDGWSSRPHSESEFRGLEHKLAHDTAIFNPEMSPPSQVRIQPIENDETRIIVPMIRNGIAEIQVVDENGEPIGGAAVEFLHIDQRSYVPSSLLNHGLDSMTAIREQGTANALAVTGYRVQVVERRSSGITDDRGIAILRNLPETPHSATRSTPADLLGGTIYRISVWKKRDFEAADQVGSGSLPRSGWKPIEIRAGETTKLQVTINPTTTPKHRMLPDPNEPTGKLKFPASVEEAMMIDATMQQIRKLE